MVVGGTGWSAAAGGAAAEEFEGLTVEEIAAVFAYDLDGGPVGQVCSLTHCAHCG